ncbi:hypothetical protein Mal15_25830 [Stieleria maiorica]|uniref:Uncharacterized protein n=1 Tax=Stieleria maiorica TaxID=2795974 RepID=A0A5B9MB59_9BACT|nr:hypothetical protein Mal15_25830 [Stieleria maiorica]
MADHIASLDVRLNFIVRWGQGYLDRHLNSASLTSSHAAVFHSIFNIRSRFAHLVPSHESVAKTRRLAIPWCPVEPWVTSGAVRPS